MGGDHAPGATVAGALEASKEGYEVVLVGDEARIRAELARLHGDLAVVHASQSVEMGEHPGQAMRRKRDNSIRRCFDLVKSGAACAMMSAGNSGAVLAGAIFVLGRLDAVERPAIAVTMPSLKGPVALLDMGANVDCKPKHLVQFALMGEVWSRRVLGVRSPRVAILANGEEESKGTDLTRAAADALKGAGLRFGGYCEGRDLLTGEHDVIVTDGFTGNVALKTMEGTAKVISTLLKQMLMQSTARKLGAILSRGAFDALKKRIDYREFGGAPLIGVNGIGVIAHGSSDALAIKNAIRVARDAARANCTAEIAEAAARADALVAATKGRDKKHAHA
jgi:glycerol-3-phosphate acyltransferase PlsX